MSFPMGDSVSLSQAIITLFQNSDKLKSMSRKARKFVLNNYSWEIIVNRLEKEFQKLISNHKQ